MKLSDLLAVTNPAAALGARLLSGAIAAVAFLLVLLWLWWIVLGKPAHDRLEAAKAHAAAVVSQGDALAASDAIGVVASSAAHDASVDVQTRSNADEIGKAPGANVPLDPALDRAGRLSLCRREVYRSSPACVALLKSHP